MVIDPEIEELEKYLTVHHANISYIWEVHDELPWGWRELIRPIQIMEQLCGHQGWSAVTIMNGVLKIKYTVNHADNQKLFDLVVKGIAIESTKTCMVCGEKGARRKTEQYFPTLCTPHYVQYVNFVAEEPFKKS